MKDATSAEGTTPSRHCKRQSEGTARILGPLLAISGVPFAGAGGCFLDTRAAWACEGAGELGLGRGGS
jgi:hypothetical protein